MWLNPWIFFVNVGVITSRRLHRKCRRFPGKIASKTRYMGVRHVWQYNIFTIFSCLLTAAWKWTKSINSVASDWFDLSEIRFAGFQCDYNHKFYSFISSNVNKQHSGAELYGQQNEKTLSFLEEAFQNDLCCSVPLSVFITTAVDMLSCFSRAEQIGP